MKHTYMKYNIQKYYTKLYIYKKAHFQQIRLKATNQTLSINFHNSYI